MGPSATATTGSETTRRDLPRCRPLPVLPSAPSPASHASPRALISIFLAPPRLASYPSSYHPSLAHQVRTCALSRTPPDAPKTRRTHRPLSVVPVLHISQPHPLFLPPFDFHALLFCPGATLAGVRRASRPARHDGRPAGRASDDTRHTVRKNAWGMVKQSLLVTSSSAASRLPARTLRLGLPLNSRLPPPPRPRSPSPTPSPSLIRPQAALPGSVPVHLVVVEAVNARRQRVCRLGQKRARASQPRIAGSRRGEGRTGAGVGRLSGLRLSSSGVQSPARRMRLGVRSRRQRGAELRAGAQVVVLALRLLRLLGLLLGLEPAEVAKGRQARVGQSVGISSAGSDEQEAGRTGSRRGLSRRRGA